MPDPFLVLATQNPSSRMADVILNCDHTRLLAPGDADCRREPGNGASAGWLDRRGAESERVFIQSTQSQHVVLARLRRRLLVGVGTVLGRQFRIPGAARGVMTAAGALAVVGMIGSAMAAWPAMRSTVVMTADAPARVSPVSVGDPAFKLAAGEKVQMQARPGEFSLVQANAGRTGCVAQKDLATVVP
jgi:hypothetical protein